MSIKWIGAFLIVTGCGGFGFSLAAVHRRETALLRGLQRALQYMQNELKYRLTPLPELCAQAGIEAGGQLKVVFTDLSRAMERQLSPDAASCMTDAIRKSKESLPVSMRRLLGQLGRSLGRKASCGVSERWKRPAGKCWTIWRKTKTSGFVIIKPWACVPGLPWPFYLLKLWKLI